MEYSEQWRTCRKLIHQYFMEQVVMKQHLALIDAEAVQMLRDLIVEPSGHMRHPKVLHIEQQSSEEVHLLMLMVRHIAV